jgi:energy-coupling factor transport system permease protein
MRGATPIHRLNPLTKLVLAAVTSVGVVVLGGILWAPVLAVVAVLIPAAIAQELGPTVRAATLLTLPLAISVVLVNVFFFPGGTEVLFRIGPFAATVEGVWLALEIVLRLFVISGAVTLFYRTTHTGDLTLDFERRGVSPRLAFVINATVGAVPAMGARAAEIVDAQRARGLDTQGSVWARIRGIVPIAGPVVLGSIGEVEERTLALEARAFGRPGRRTLLRLVPDSGAERITRWALVLAVPAIVGLRVAGLPI